MPAMARECMCALKVIFCSSCSVEHVIVGYFFICSANQVSSVQSPKDAVTCVCVLPVAHF